ncbi:MAG: DNA-directed RNA polymerase subunit beta, partial [Ruminococcus sp.]|nr:DNA-directed RNA polymerase subunit beta [Ruminococcus sp.]
DDTIGRVETYEAIVKGQNVPKPGIPESFKVLIKELQSLALDVKVLDINQEEIDLKQNFDDDPMPARNNFKDEETENLNSLSDDDMGERGFEVGDSEDGFDRPLDDDDSYDGEDVDTLEKEDLYSYDDDDDEDFSLDDEESDFPDMALDDDPIFDE